MTPHMYKHLVQDIILIETKYYISVWNMAQNPKVQGHYLTFFQPNYWWRKNTTGQ